MPGQMFSEYMLSVLKRDILEFVLVQPTLYNFFKANDMVENIGEGIKKQKVFDWKKPAPGELGSGIHNVPIISPQFGEVTAKLAYITALVQISKDDVDQFKNNPKFGGNLIRETVQRAMPVMVNQVDQFCAWGDAMKEPLDWDVVAGSGTFTGVFNGFSETRGGIDQDDDMQVLGDYVATVENMDADLRTGGFVNRPGYLFSSIDTRKFAALGAQWISNVGITERRRVMEYEQEGLIKGWETSPNFVDYADHDRLVMVIPKIRVRKNKVVPTARLIQGYNFHVHPEHNGGTYNGFYEWLLIWSGVIVEDYPGAIRHTRDLTLTS